MFPGEIPGRSRLALLGRLGLPQRERVGLVVVTKVMTFFTTVSFAGLEIHSSLGVKLYPPQF